MRIPMLIILLLLCFSAVFAQENNTTETQIEEESSIASEEKPGGVMATISWFFSMIPGGEDVWKGVAITLGCMIILIYITDKADFFFTLFLIGVIGFAAIVVISVILSFIFPERPGIILEGILKLFPKEAVAAVVNNSSIGGGV